MNIVFDNGMLQSRDINPAAPGVTTMGLTNPRVEDNLEAAGEMLTGEAGRKVSPVIYLCAAAAALFVVSLIQN